MTKEKKDVTSGESDVLDQVRSFEKAVKANLLIKAIKELKRLARSVNELKEESLALLEEVGMSEKDSKRILDFVNESSEVKLSEDDKKNIRDGVKSSRIKTQRKIEETLEQKYCCSTTNELPDFSGGIYSYYSSSVSTDGIVENLTLTNDGTTLELKL